MSAAPILTFPPFTTATVADTAADTATATNDNLSDNNNVSNNVSNNNSSGLTSFLPTLLLPYLTSPNFKPSVLPLPSKSTIMISDASGFTKLSNKLSADKMSTILNTFFSLMIQTIDDNQGSVLKFAGDALISHFNSTENAVRCSVALIQCLNGFRATEEDELGFHVAVVQVDDLKGEVLGDEEEKVRERERELG